MNLLDGLGVLVLELLDESRYLETIVAGILHAPLHILQEAVGLLDLVAEVSPLHEHLELLVKTLHAVVAFAHDTVELLRAPDVPHLVHGIAEAPGDIPEVPLHLGGVKALVGHVLELLVHASEPFLDHRPLPEEMSERHLLHGSAEMLLRGPCLAVHGLLDGVLNPLLDLVEEVVELLCEFKGKLLGAEPHLIELLPDAFLLPDEVGVHVPLVQCTVE